VAAVQLAKHYGARVTAVCSGRNAELVRRLGADEVVDYTSEDFAARTASFDVVFDAVGKSSFRRSRDALKDGGIYLTTVPSPAILIQMAWTSRFGRKRAGILFTGLAKPEERARDLVFLADLAQSGALAPSIGTTHRLEDAAAAHRHVDSGRKAGSAVLTMGEVAA
jgi:NADPH:quinone reductase-like Zn-dependent oxidoreductase